MTAQNIGATVVFIMVDIVVLELLWSLHPAKGGGPGESEAGGRPAFRRFMARVAALSLASVLVVFLVWTVKEQSHQRERERSPLRAEGSLPSLQPARV